MHRLQLPDFFGVRVEYHKAARPDMRIVAADRHQIIRRGLQLIVSRRADWNISAEAGEAEELWRVLEQDSHDILVIDPRLGDRSSIEVLEQIRTQFPRTPVLILSSQPEEQFAIPALRAGARGYIEKDATADEILEAIERVAGGRYYVSERVTQLMAEELTSATGGAPHERLSPRELDVFLRLARGETVTSIGTALGISVKTVSTYRTRVLEKTGFRSNADIVAYAIRMHLLE